MDNENKFSTDIDYKDMEGAIEAILFAAGHPIEYTKLAEVLGIGEVQAKRRVKNFAEKYNADEKKGIMLLVFESTCQLCTKEKFLPYIKDALGIKKGGNLSASSLEVLAIIAYNQPVTKAFVENIRGVDCSYAISSLMDKGLVDSKDRLDVPGRPMLYSTTENFLRCFGISKLDELPNLDIKASSLQNSNNDSDGEQMTLNI